MVGEVLVLRTGEQVEVLVVDPRRLGGLGHVDHEDVLLGCRLLPQGVEGGGVGGEDGAARPGQSRVRMARSVVAVAAEQVRQGLADGGGHTGRRVHRTPGGQVLVHDDDPLERGVAGGEVGPYGAGVLSGVVLSSVVLSGHTSKR